MEKSEIQVPGQSGFIKLGSVVPVPLANEGRFAGVEILIELVGMARAREWAYRSRAIDIEEARRIHQLRQGETPESVPQFWDGSRTKESADANVALNRDILAETLKDIRGIGWLEGRPQSELIDALDGYGELENAAAKALAVQSPSQIQFLFSGS